MKKWAITKIIILDGMYGTMMYHGWVYILTITIVSKV